MYRCINRFEENILILSIIWFEELRYLLPYLKKRWKKQIMYLTLLKSLQLPGNVIYLTKKDFRH